MGKVSGNARCVDDIVEGELVHEGGELQEQGQRLARGGGQQELMSKGSDSSLGWLLTCPIPPAAPATTIFDDTCQPKQFSAPALFVIVWWRTGLDHLDLVELVRVGWGRGPISRRKELWWGIADRGVDQ